MLFILLALILLGKQYLSKTDDISIFNTEKTLGLRGFLAVMIVFSHLTQHFDEEGFTPPHLHLLTYVARSSAPYVVSVFFAISAYGLIVSYKNKGESYLKGFMRKRALKLFLPLFPLIVMYQVYLYIVGDFNLSRTLYGLSAGGTKYLCPNTWFVFSIFFIYLFFFVVSRFNRGVKRISSVLSAIIIVYSFLLYAVGWGQHWYISNLGFAIGLFLACNERQIRSCMVRYKHLSICAVSLGFASLYLLQINLLAYAIVCGLTVMPVYVLICSNSSSFDNKSFRFLGEYSYDIYIAHGVLISVCSFIVDPWLYLGVVIGSILPLSILIHEIARLTGGLLDKVSFSKCV